MPPDKPLLPPNRKTGRPKGSKSTVASEDRLRRLGRPPGTGHLQRAKVLTMAVTTQPAIGHHPNPQMLPEPAVSQGRSIWCVFTHLIPFACTDS